MRFILTVLGCFIFNFLVLVDTVCYCLAVKDELKEVRKEKINLLNDINEKYKEIERCKYIILKAKERIDEIEETAKPLQEEYNRAQQRFEEVDNLFKKRIRNLYQKNQNNYMLAIVTSKSFGDFLIRYELIRLIVGNDYKIVEKRKRALDDVARKKKNYDLKIMEQQKVIDETKKQYLKIMQNISLKSKDLKSLKKIEELHEDELIKINLEEWKKKILRFPYTGSMIRPTKTKITSSFGYRFHPILRVSRLHTGIDFEGPFGKPIYAVADGVVVSSKASPGYGWLLTIYHGEKNGKSVFTRYAHCYPYQVKVRLGQQVSKGQQIACIGDNGFSTGPHLHFEVRVGKGDNPPSVNPKNWLKL